ncbi:MAG: DUF1573 domain-containing protein [Prevotella sp.]|nr:DUF1573 domain-containing protein [Prevotella sp.]
MGGFRGAWSLSFSLFFLLFSMDIFAQRISAEHDTYDFGSIMYEVPAVAKFELTNKGNDLIIEKVRTNCGCTTVNYPKNTILKGDKFTIEVEYDARQLGHFEKEVAIYGNDSDTPYSLKIRGVVVDEVVDYAGQYEFTVGDVRTDKNNIEFDNVNNGDMPIQRLHIYNSSGEAVSPVLMHLPNYLTATMSPTTIAPGRSGVATITLNSLKLRDYGLTKSSIYLGMFPGDKVSANKEISVSAVLIPGFGNMSETQKANAPSIDLSSAELDLGSFGDKSDKSGTITIKNQGRTTLDIRSMQMFTPGLKVKLNKTKLAPGESAKLKITAYKKLLKEARSKPRVLMITNDPDNAKVIIPVNVE